jgi:hypothetical protein
VAGVQEYLGPERNEEITPEQEIQRQAPTLKQTYKEAMTEALIAYSEKSVKVGPNSAGRFDVGGAAAIRANAISSGSMGAELLNSSSGSRASFGGAMPRSVSGEVEPSMSTKKTVKSGREKKESNESIITRSIEKIEKQIEEEEKKRSIALENIYKIDVDRTKNILRNKFTIRKKWSDELSQEKMRLEISSGKYSLSTGNDKSIKKIKDLEERIDKLNQNISKHQGNLRDRSRGTSDEYKMSSDRISQLKTSLEEERDVLSGYKEEEKLRQMDSLEESQKKMIAHSDQKKLKSQHVRFKKRQEAESGFYGGVKWGKEKALKLLEKEGEGRPSKRQEAESGFYGGVKWGREKALKLLEKEGEGRPSIDYKGISPEQEEALKRTSFLRSQIGTVKPKKGQTQEDADFRAATKYFEQQHIEKFAKADFERAMKDKEELKVKGTGSKTARFGSAAIDNVRSSGYTSAAQERGMEASALAQSNYEATASNRESVYGATGDEAGGSGVAVLTIKLADGLKGDLDNASGLRIELLQGSSR